MTSLLRRSATVRILALALVALAVVVAFAMAYLDGQSGTRSLAAEAGALELLEARVNATHALSQERIVAVRAAFEDSSPAGDTTVGRVATMETLAALLDDLIAEDGVLASEAEALRTEIERIGDPHAAITVADRLSRYLDLEDAVCCESEAIPGGIGEPSSRIAELGTALEVLALDAYRFETVVGGLVVPLVGLARPGSQRIERRRLRASQCSRASLRLRKAGYRDSLCQDWCIWGRCRA